MLSSWVKCLLLSHDDLIKDPQNPWTRRVLWYVINPRAGMSRTGMSRGLNGYPDMLIGDPQIQ